MHYLGFRELLVTLIAGGSDHYCGGPVLHWLGRSHSLKPVPPKQNASRDAGVSGYAAQHYPKIIIPWDLLFVKGIQGKFYHRIFLVSVIRMRPAEVERVEGVGGIETVR